MLDQKASGHNRGRWSFGEIRPWETREKKEFACGSLGFGGFGGVLSNEESREASGATARAKVDVDSLILSKKGNMCCL